LSRQHREEGRIIEEASVQTAGLGSLELVEERLQGIARVIVLGLAWTRVAQGLHGAAVRADQGQKVEFRRALSFRRKTLERGREPRDEIGREIPVLCREAPARPRNVPAAFGATELERLAQTSEPRRRRGAAQHADLKG